MKSDEAELVLKAQGGDKAAFDELIARFRDFVVAVAFSALGDRADAEDVAQDASLRAYRFIHTFKRESKFTSWLYRITINQCWTLRKRKRPACSVELNEGMCSNEANLYAENPQQGATRHGLESDFGSSFLAGQNRKFQKDEVVHVALEVIDELVPFEALVARATFFEGYTPVEVAELLGTTVEQVNVIVKKFARHCKKHLQGLRKRHLSLQPVEKSP
jgi:RNA polymerase sigma factor (sigma-70 family)